MLCSLLAAYTVVALLSVGEPPPAPRHRRPTAAPDSAARAAVVAEVRAFYRDLDDRNWTALLDHFIPAKVTARWAPPATNDAWVRLAVPAPAARGAAGAPGQCEPRAAVAIVGDWARVRVRRCAGPADEVWLLRVSGRWKIVHLELGSARPDRAARAAAPTVASPALRGRPRTL